MTDLEDKENMKPALNTDQSELVKLLSIEESEIDTDLGNEYKKSIKDQEYLEDQITRIQREIEKCRNEGLKKDQCLRTCVKEKTENRKVMGELITAIKRSEQNIIKQSEELFMLKRKIQKDTERIFRKEVVLSEISEKYNRASNTLQDCKEKEGGLIKNLEDATHKLSMSEAKYASLQNAPNGDIEKINLLGEGGDNQYNRDVARYQSQIKRLEIKINSLETALKQKSEESVSLSALYDDITSKQSST